MKKVKNFLAYFSTYIFVTMAVACVTVMISGMFGEKEIPKVSAESPIGAIVNNITSMQDAKLSIDVCIEKENQSIELVGDICIVIGSQITDIKAFEFAGDCVFNGQKMYVKASLISNTLYLQLDDKHIKVKLDSAKSLLNNLLSIFNINFDNATQDIMGKVDINKLMAQDKDMVTIKEEENQLIVTLKLFDGFVVDIITDKEYNIKNIKLEDFIFADYTISANIDMNSVNAGNTVEVEEDKYEDMSEVLNIIDVFSKGLDKFLENKNLTAELNANVLGQDVSIKFNIDLNNELLIKFEANILNIELWGQVVNQTIYINVYDSCIVVPLDEIKDIVKVLSDKISAIIDITEIAFSPQDLEKYLIQFLPYIQVLDNKIAINVNDVYNAELQVNEQNSTYQLNFAGPEVQANMLVYSTNEIFEIKDNNKKIYDLTNIHYFIDALLNTIQEDTFGGKGTINIKTESKVEKINFEVALKCDFDNVIQLILNKDIDKILQSINGKIVLSYENIVINAHIQNSAIYISTYDMKIKFAFNEIENILDFVESEFGIKLDALKNDVFIENVNSYTLDSLAIYNNRLSILLNNGSNIEINFDEKIKDIAFISQSLECNMSKEDVVYTALSENQIQEYIHYSYLLDKIVAIKNIFSQNKFNVDLNVKYTNNGVQKLDAFANVRLDLSQGLLVNINLNALNNNVEVQYENDVFYVIYDNFKICTHMQGIYDLLSVVENLFGFEINFDVMSNSLQDIKDKDISTLIGCIKKLELQEDSLILVLNENAILGIDKDIEIQIDFNQNSIQYILIKNLYISNKDKFEISIDLKEYEEITPVQDKNEYIDITNSSNLASVLIKLIQGKNLSGEMDVQFPLNNSTETLSVLYNLDIDTEGLHNFITNKETDKNIINVLKYIEGYIKAEYRGLEAELYIQNSVVYIEAVGLKVSFNISEVTNIRDFINAEFGANIDISNLITNTDFSIDNLFSNLIIEEDKTSVLFEDGTTIQLIYADVLQQIIVKMNNNISINATMKSVSYEEITEEMKSQYIDYSVVTNFIKVINNLLNTKQFNLSLNANYFVNNSFATGVSASLVMDIKDALQMNAGLEISGATNLSANVNVFDNMYYIDYDGLKVSINQNNLQEILALALKLFGIEIPGISWIDEITENIDVSNIQNLIPELDMSNPLDILNYIEGIELDSSSFKIKINASLFSGQNEILNLNVLYEGSNIRSIIATNVPLSSDEKVDINLEFFAFNKVEEIENKDKYIDLSGSADILASLINTTSLMDYKISGTVNVVAEIIKLPINMNVKVDAQVKIVDKKPVAYVQISKIPVIVGVNNDVPLQIGDTNGGQKRTLHIYYIDNYMYFYRHEKVSVGFFGSRTYEKKLKISIDDFIADPFGYILGYGLGFSDSIMNKIYEAIEITKNRPTPIDKSNVLLSYKNVNEDLFEIVLNMKEITANDNMDKATISLGATNIVDKKYLNKIMFNLNMPLLSGVEINVATSDMTLYDIGSVVDVSNVINYANSYPYAVGEMRDASNGKW